MKDRVELEVVLDAPPRQVFEALVEPELLQQWFAEFAEVSVEEKSFDFWGRFTPQTPDREGGSHELRAVESDRLLQFVWHLEGRDTVVTLRLEPQGPGTRLHLLHEGVREWESGHYALSDYWVACLENLRGLLERGVVGQRPDFTEASGSPLELSIDLDASAEAVFGALVEPEQLTRYFPNQADVEPRVGGRIDFHWEGGGPQKILEIDPGRKLAYSWQYGHDVETVVHWELEESGGRTRLVLVHSGFQREAPDYWVGWIAVVNQLKNMVETEAWQRIDQVASDVPEG